MYHTHTHCFLGQIVHSINVKDDQATLGKFAILFEFKICMFTTS